MAFSSANAPSPFLHTDSALTWVVLTALRPGLPFPCPGLMPTVLLGTAVGAAVVYGIDEGDPMAVQKKVGVEAIA
jgi:hypothetical protein